MVWDLAKVENKRKLQNNIAEGHVQEIRVIYCLSLQHLPL